MLAEACHIWIGLAICSVIYPSAVGLRFRDFVYSGYS